MAPSIQAQHVVAVTIPTIAVIFLTYLWYKKRSSSITRGRNDPGGGGGTSRKRARHRNMVSTMPSVVVPNSVEQEILPEVVKNAMQKVIRDLETASPIQEICSDSEDNVVVSAENTSSDATIMPVNDLESLVEEKIFGLETSSSLEENNNKSTKVTDENESDIVNSKPEVKEKNEKEIRCELTDASKSPQALSVLVVSPNVENNSCNDRMSQWSAIMDCADEMRRSNEYVGPVGHACSHLEPIKPAPDSKNCRENAANGTDNDDLDVAVLKLESMRLGDRPKRKSTSSKRLSAPKEIISMAGAIVAAAEAENNSTTPSGKSKLPSSITSQLTSPLSKMKKRKSKKKSKNTGTGSGDEIIHNCKSQDETTSAVSVTNTCDSKKSFDPCGRTSSNVKSAIRICLADSEQILRSSTEKSSIRCNLKKNDDYDLKVIEHHHQADCDNERDSANHSPVDTMLDSQLVQFSDAHSEGSSDSGKGCSEGAASPTPHTPVGGGSVSEDQNTILLYQFVIPQEHVGKLIGKHGQFINNIKANSNTKIYIKKHPTSFKQKICALEGTQQEINKALELIRIRFPEESYTDVTLEEFPLSLPIPCPLRSELFQLDLVEGVNNDVVISSVVSAGHLFLQQPMHPTYQSLTLLNLNMSQVYSSPEAPVVLKPIKDNIVAAPAMDGWYRAQIVSVDEETETCEVRFLDYGGYLSLNTSCLRAVRADFLTLPFQAVECYLANVAPIDETWCDEAKLIVQGLTYGHILQAQVFDYTPDGIPLILLYAVHGSQVILINQELIARGYAYPTLPSEGAQSEEYYFCS